MKSLICPKCAAAIEVPNGYTKAGIFCPSCRTPVDVRTGGVYQKATKLAPAAGVEETPPALAIVEDNAPVTGVAPPHMYDPPPPPPAKPDRTWLKYTIGGALVVVAGLIGLFGWTQYSKAKELEQAPLTAKWETMPVPAGWFSVDLPGNAQSSQSAGPAEGTERHTWRMKVGESDWLVEWYDLGFGPATAIPLDMAAELERYASKVQYKNDEILRMDLTGFEGRKAVMSDHDDRHGRARILRRGNRVYFLAATGLTDGNLEAGERFLSSLKLLQASYPEGKPGPLALVSTGGARLVVYADNVVTFSGGFTGGTPPYILTLNSVNLPTGLKAETAGARVVISGVTDKAGDYGVGFTLLDQAEARLEGRIDVVVEGNPFAIVCDPPTDGQDRLIVDAAAGVKIRASVDGPVKQLSGDPAWNVPWLPTGMEWAPELDGIVITGPAWSGEGAKITLEWTASNAAGRVFKCKKVFRLTFKTARPPDG